MHKEQTCRIPQCLCHTDAIYAARREYPAKKDVIVMATHKKILLVKIPGQSAQVIPFDRHQMKQLPAMQIEPETGLETHDIEITFSDGLPLYFVRSSRYPEYYYPVRGGRCRCLESQDHGYCDHVRQVEDFKTTNDLSAIASSVA
jgi:hypothetical protein